ncbi:phosphopeptide-binding protein [Cytophagales bacterium LB-30]|uniref:Phosphopeptide-binding protein n=1 Tax=Shiella aurantiaca TaxID=3058365 RepID=A0ABT8F2S1_9BACT|nr:phosphopeptide-binding protein [Shiella aurantiaca]MDN4164598.1 phosphopeptide-binding protein [Shiella aurantiaca]
MKYFVKYTVLVGLSSLLFACGASEKKAEEEKSNSDSTAISLVAVTESSQFPDAQLELMGPGEGERLAAGKYNFQFEVKNYELTAQTLDKDVRQCANSAQGQHIHFLLNNSPYTALYAPNNEVELTDGHYVLLSFLSRSYHESLKQYGAYVLRQFTVGDAPADTVDLTAPHMFYSRPKGEYKGADVKNLMLDFYLVNTELSADGNKVKAVIDGQEFLLDKWLPYTIEGLGMGTHTVKLTLVDNAGNTIPGPFNEVERTFTLSE